MSEFLKIEVRSPGFGWKAFVNTGDMKKNIAYPGAEDDGLADRG